MRASNVCDDGNFSSPKECALAPVPDRMLAHAARAKGTCDDFSLCRAFWSFWAPKGHDITTTKRIYDCRLRVSCIKEYMRLFNVLSVLKRYSPYSLQVNDTNKAPARGCFICIVSSLSLEESGLFSYNFAQAEVCKAACTQTEQLIAQPFLS